MPRKLSRRRQRKQAVLDLLRARDTGALLALDRRDRRTMSTLVSLLSEPDDLLRWRAIEALGRMAGQRAADGEVESIKVMVRRQLWTMTEESGGTAWHAAEAIGAMLYFVPELAPELATVLAANQGTAPYEAGCWWAVALLARGPARGSLQAWVGEATAALSHPRAAVRGHAARALGALQARQAAGALEDLHSDDGQVTVYDLDRGELSTLTVAQMAGAALAEL
jgi:HEAT repeat protein